MRAGHVAPPFGQDVHVAPFVQDAHVAPAFGVRGLATSVCGFSTRAFGCRGLIRGRGGASAWKARGAVGVRGGDRYRLETVEGGCKQALPKSWARLGISP